MENKTPDKIKLVINDSSFEYDIYHLVKAFFADTEIETEIETNIDQEILQIRENGVSVLMNLADECLLIRCITPFEKTDMESDKGNLFVTEEKDAGNLSASEKNDDANVPVSEDPCDANVPVSEDPSDANVLVSEDPCDANVPVSEDPCDANVPIFEEQDEANLPKTRKEQKNAIKKALYEALRDYTGRELPWGNLTGIRPVRIPLKMLEQGYKNAEIAKYMRETYFTSPKKTALAIAIANRERDLLEKLEPEKGYSLYVGIPFCPSICLYCSFGSHPIEKYRTSVGPYLEALFKELSFIAESMQGKKLTSIYIGGGTPTSLDEKEFSELLAFICEQFPFRDLVEFTVEAGRPDTITEQKLYAMLAAGANRISINPQTMNQKTLDLIGRAHTIEQTNRAFDLARSVGFENINMDLIAGLPGEGPDEVRETLRQIESLSPDSLTIHSLALKRSSRLALFKDEYAPLSFHNSEEIMECAAKTAVSLHMHPYYMYRQKNIAGNLENVGYARDDCYGIYNILIMEEKQTILSAGAGAMTKWVYGGGRIERTPNVKDVDSYIHRIDEMIDRKKVALVSYEAERYN